MAVSAYATGTQTATVTTEHFLSSPNVAGRFQLVLDLTNMAALDVLEIRGYKMAITSGTARVVFAEQFTGAQPTDAMVYLSQIIPNALTDSNAVRFSIKQTYGTGRDFYWTVLNIHDAKANVTQAMGYGLMIYGTVTTGSSTTSVTTSACSVAAGVANQFTNSTMVFATDTTTANLRGVRTNVIACTASSTPTFTVGTLPATPASGDTFVLV